jgi:hypothetical protein
MRVVRHLDHDAVDARLGASLHEYGRVSREAGLTSEEAVMRLRRLLDDGSDSPPAGRAARWGLPAIPVRKLVVGIVALIACGAIVAIGVTTLDSDNQAASTPVASEEPVPPAGVAGFAELFVSAYLGQAGEGAEHHLEPFLSEPIDMLGLPPGRLYVQNLATVDVRPDRDGWVVDVAAQVLRRMDSGYGDPVIQQYRVQLTGGDELRALALPVLTPGI